MKKLLNVVLVIAVVGIMAVVGSKHDSVFTDEQIARFSVTYDDHYEIGSIENIETSTDDRGVERINFVVVDQNGKRHWKSVNKSYYTYLMVRE